MRLSGEEEHNGKQDADDPGPQLDLLELAGEGVDDNVGDHTEGNTVGNVVGEGHQSHGQEGGNCGAGIAPFDVLDSADHEDAYIDQGGGGCTAWNHSGYRSQEHGDEEEQCGEHSGQAGSAALCNACRGFNEGGDSGGTADSTGAGGDSVSQHGAIHVGDVAVLVYQTANGAGSVEGAQGIEHIHHTEGEGGGCDGNNEVAHAVCLDIRLKVEALGKDLAEADICEILKGSKDIGTEVGGNTGIVEAGNGNQSQYIVQDCTADNAPKNSALDLPFAEDGDDKYSEDGDKDGHDLCPGGGSAEEVEGMHVDQGSYIVYYQACILHTQEGDEQADTGSNGSANCLGDGFEDHLAQAGEGQDDKQETVKKNQHEGVCVREAKYVANSENEERVQTHA